MREPAIIEKECNGHRFRWVFREFQAFQVEELIEDQLTEPHPGFESLSIGAAIEAMREARIAQQQLLAKGATR